MESSETSDISQGKVDMSSGNYYGNATNQALCSECNIYHQGEENCQAYVWHVSSLWTEVEGQICSQKEKEKYEDIERISAFCPNKKTIKDLQTSFGKLHRVGVLGDAKWTEEENSTKACNYVHAIHKCTNKGSGETVFMPEASGLVKSKGLGGSLSMVVDTFVSESVRHNIASSIWCDLDSVDLEGLVHLYKSVVTFGFDHIIIIGEMLYGLLFLDCYGRVFQWEAMEQVIWPLGNSLEDVKSRLEQEDRVIWIAEDGVIYEEPSDSLNPSDTSDTSDASDTNANKGSKKKKKKKR